MGFFFTVFTRYSHLRSTGLGIKHEQSTKQPLRMTDPCTFRTSASTFQHPRCKYRNLSNDDGDAEDNLLVILNLSMMSYGSRTSLRLNM